MVKMMMVQLTLLKKPPKRKKLQNKKIQPLIKVNKNNKLISNEIIIQVNQKEEADQKEQKKEVDQKNPKFEIKND